MNPQNADDQMGCSNGILTECVSLITLSSSDGGTQ